LMHELNLDVAGEFLVMAATLIHIKSKMLLPRPDPKQDEPEEDPREALVRRLVEHQRFKAAAELLHEREIPRSAQWTRPEERGARRRAARAGARGRPVQPDDGVPAGARAGTPPAAGDPAARADFDRGPDRAARSAACRPRGVRLRGAVRRRRHAGGYDRHFPGAARDDPAAESAGLPADVGRPDPRLPA